MRRSRCEKLRELPDDELEKMRRRHMLALANLEAEVARRRVDREHRVRRECSRIANDESASPAKVGTPV